MDLDVRGLPRVEQLTGALGNGFGDERPGLDLEHVERSVFVLRGGGGFDLIEGGSGASSLFGNAGGDLLIGGDVTLDLLETVYPTWEAPPDAQSRIDAGEVDILWDDILWEVFGIA